MNTATQPATRGRKPRRVPPPRPAPDALALLKADHAELLQMFTAFENTRSVNNKRFLVQRICATVAEHTQLKEEVFYPAIESVVPDPLPAHGAMNELALHILSLEPVAEQVDEPIKLLAGHVTEHVSNLQGAVFPKVDASDIDLVELAEHITRHKAELAARRRQG